jgi:uncharacterized protein YgbK (DUF1537 family)
MPLLLGCIADDFTGATDLASMLVGGGMRVLQLLGVPDSAAALDDVDALVIALKTRSIEPEDAVRQSLAALLWLQSRGARRFFFKYCSTFDSTEKGNIGPVAAALLDELKSPITIACPAFPDNGRTVYQGHLFVGSKLLSESGMENHPLTPMTDSNLVRFLQKQTTHAVGLVPHANVVGGATAIERHLVELQTQGWRIAIVDALTNDDLQAIATGCVDLPLITGGSGVALGLPDAYRAVGLQTSARVDPPLPRVQGFQAVLAGSCSAMTLRQVEHMKRHWPALPVRVDDMAAGRDVSGEAIRWGRERLPEGPVLVYSSVPPEEVAAVQRRYGRDGAGRLVEQTLARIANGLVELGVRRLVVAGGETAGAVLSALGIKALRIGPSIVPGVPWTETLDQPRLALALKSGNFGKDDFFIQALGMLP